jgi:cytochrome c55X
MPPLRAGAALALALGWTLPAAVAAEPPSPARQAELRHLLLQDCGACHGLTLKGGLGPPLLPGALAGKDAEGLAQIVLRGVPGTPMPPWGPEISEAEASWLAGLLKEGVR